MRTSADIRMVTEFEVSTMSDELPNQLAEVSRAVTGRIQSLEPEFVVVRRADMPPRASNADGPRVRLLMTGAVVAASRLLIDRTRLRTGRECGSAYGKDKATVDEAAGHLVSNRRLVEAAAAALSGLVADRA